MLTYSLPGVGVGHGGKQAFDGTFAPDPSVAYLERNPMARHPRPTLQQDCYALLHSTQRLRERAEAQGADEIAWDLMLIAQEVRRLATGHPPEPAVRIPSQTQFAYPKSEVKRRGSSS